MKPLERITFVLNASKPGAVELGQELAAQVSKELGVETHLCSEWPLPPGILEGSDACCVLGGDGTLLGLVEQAIEFDTPLFGVNQGKLGFLATISPPEAKEAIRAIAEGRYERDERVLIKGRSENGILFWALNDLVIKSQDPSRLISLTVNCSGEFISNYYSDGLIFSTPTGSTAYNLSANGPLIMPGARTMAMTPICPHTLSNRTLIFDDSVDLEVVCEDPQEAHVSIDGRTTQRELSFPLSVTVGTRRLTLLQPEGHSHFHVLRSKLHWR